LNTEHHVWASYAVTSEHEIFYAGVKLPSGRTVQLFVNRETGLVVVDVGNQGGTGGNEILRVDANKIKMP
jgi:hypothetical protein